MSANPVGRQPAPANETPVAKLQRLGGPRVTKALDALDKVGNLGALIKTVEGIDQSAVVNQILQAVAEKFKDMQVRLQTGERSKSVFSINV